MLWLLLLLLLRLLLLCGAIRGTKGGGVGWAGCHSAVCLEVTPSPAAVPSALRSCRRVCTPLCWSCCSCCITTRYANYPSWSWPA